MNETSPHDGSPAGRRGIHLLSPEYYDIGLELIDSGFEYFAGGGLLKPDGHDKEAPSENLYELAEAAGYKVIFPTS